METCVQRLVPVHAAPDVQGGSFLLSYAPLAIWRTVAATLPLSYP